MHTPVQIYFYLRSLIRCLFHSFTTSKTTHHSSSSTAKHLYSDTTDNGTSKSFEPSDSILNTAGVIDPQTGRVLTVGEAIQMRILDVRTGEIVVGQERITLEEAIKRKLIDATLANNLLRPGAAVHAGKSISLLEVIQRELMEAENGYDSTEKRIKVITSTTSSTNDRNGGDVDKVDDAAATAMRGRQQTVAEAIENGIVDPKSGLYRTRTGQLISINEAVRNGYLIQSETVKIKSNELCLSDAIVHGLVDTSGWVVDRNSGDKFRLDSAIANGLITANVREVVDAKNDVKVTLKHALDTGILNAKTGRYMQNVTKEKLTFIEAKNRQLIGKPMTLKDVCDLNLLEQNGRIISPTRKSKLSIIEAINIGVLDSDTIKSITKTKDERLTLAEALAEGIILPESRYCDYVTHEDMSIPEAVDRGLISSVSQRSIFNIDGFKDPHSTDFVSLNAALAKNILRKKDEEFQLDTGKGNWISLSAGVESGLIRPEVFEMLSRPIGVFDAKGKELTVLELVYFDLIDPRSGYLLHPKTKVVLPLDQAIESKLITADGALLLSSLLNITLTTETVTRTVRRYVTITENDPKSQVEQILTFTDAVRLGYIDEKRQLYTDPATGKIYSIQQALNHALIVPDSNSAEIPMPAKRSTITIVHKAIVPQLNETVEKIKTVAPEYSTFHTETKVEKKRDTKTITTDFLTAEQQPCLEVPTEGWALSTAIEHRLFDPMTGLFHIVATDRLVSLEECINLEIINPLSVSVVDPSNGRKITIRRALEKRVIDATGNYRKSNSKFVGMKQAIEAGFIILEMPTKAKGSETSSPSISSSSSHDIPSPEPIQIVPGVIYDPSTALVIFTESGRSENIVAAAAKNLIDPNTVKVLDPKTGTTMTVAEAIARNVIDKNTGEMVDSSNRRIDLINAAKLGLLTVAGSPLVAVAGAIETIKMVLDPKSGQEIPIEIAFERGLVTRDQLIQAYADAPAKVHSQTYGTRVTHSSPESKYAVSHGSPMHTTILHSPERETKPMILQKMRKKIVKPTDAANKGLIDTHTADILNTKATFIDASGDIQSLADAVQQQQIDGNSGKIVDPQRGDVLTINEAIERGILDADGTNQVLVPLNKSLSIPQLCERGLIDPISLKIIHPETGVALTLREAIVCEIVDPLSKLRDPRDGVPVTLQYAIETGVIDDERNLIDSRDLLTAIEHNVFMPEIVKSKSSTIEEIPPIGMTLPVAVKRGLIDATTKEFVHPITGKRTPLAQAIEQNLIMALPYTPNVDSVSVADAMDANLIDVVAGTVRHPKTGETLPIGEAVENGLLVVKPLPELIALHTSGPVTSVTETVTSYHTITTKTVELLSGYVLVSPNEVKHVQTGQIISVADAKRQGIIKDESQTSEQFATREIKVNFSDAIRRGLVDIKAGTYTDPASGTIMPIQQAVNDGILETDDKSTSDDGDSGETTPKTEAMTLTEAIETIYDEKTKRFRDPKNPQRLVSFTDALREGIVDENSIVYDVTSGKAQTLQDSVRCGLLDAQTGEVRQPATGTKINVKQAAKMGLLAVVGAPILAGMAVADAVKKVASSASAKTKPVPTERAQRPEAAARTKLTEETKPPKVPLVTVSSTAIETVTAMEAPAKQYPTVTSTMVTTAYDDEKPLLRINETLTPEQLEEYGIFDAKTETFINPETQERIPFYSVIYDLNVFDPANIYVKDLSQNVYEPFDVALEKPLIDKNTGHMVDSKSGQRVPFVECARRRWILERIPEEDETELDVEEPTSPTLSVEIVEELEPQSIDEGIKTGTIRIERLMIKDPATDEVLPMALAIDRGIVDMRRGLIVNRKTKETIEFGAACEEGILFAAKQPPVALEALIRQGLYDREQGVVYDLDNRNSYNLQSAIDSGIVRPDISLVKNEKTNEVQPLDVALNQQIVLYTGQVKRANNELLPLDVAFDEGLLFTKPIKWDLLDVLIKQYYSPKTGTFLNPKSGQRQTLHDALQIGWIDGVHTLVKDEQIDDAVPLKDAIASGLIDAERGIVTRPQLTLDEALSKGYLISANKPYSLVDLLIRHLYDPMTGLLTIDGVKISLEQALKDGLVHTHDMVVKDPRTGEIITLLEAIRRGIVDPRSGIAIDPRTGLKLTLIDAYERGILLQSKRKCSLPDAVFKGIYDPKSGKFSTSVATEKLSAERAIRRGIIDAQSTIVNVKGRVLPFELAAESGIVDIRRGIVVDDYDNRIDFREAFDRGILIEVKKPISLCEALLKGLYDEKTGLFMDPKSGKRLTIAQSLARNLIDPTSVQMKDPSTGRYKSISLLEATETGLINGENSQILHGTSRITLKEAFDMGVLCDTNAPISIQRAIHQGLYDAKTGKIHDNKSDRKITVLEATRKFIINPQLPCYFDEHEEQLLSLGEACRARIIDRREGVFKEPASDVFVPLNEAMALGLIVDIESGSFGLYETISMRLYDRQSKQIVHPATNRKMSLRQACEEDLVSAISSLVKDTTSGKYFRLNEAIESGLVNDTTGLYILPTYVIDLHEARKRGLIVSNQKQLSVAKAVKMQLHRVDTGKFVDPSLNVAYNLQEAIDHGLIDADSTVFKNLLTGQYKSLKQAIAEGDIDVAKGNVIDPKTKLPHSYEVALEKGLLVTVDRPITGRALKRRDSIDLSLTPMSPMTKTPREMTLREAILHDYISAETAVVKDPLTGKFKALKHILKQIDPENVRAIIDPTASFFVFDKTLVIYTREPLSFDYAVESKQLDLSTGKFTDTGATTTKVYALKEAVGIGLIDPESALIKDGAKQKLVRLPEAFRKGLIDADKANVLDTQTSKLNSLQSACESGLLTTPKRSFGLIEALNYQLYRPNDGTFIDPFVTPYTTDDTNDNNTESIKQSVTLNDAIVSGLVDPTTTVVRDTANGTIVSLTSAIALRLVDAVHGRLTKTDGEQIDLVKALEKGYLLPAEQRVSFCCKMHIEHKIQETKNTCVIVPRTQIPPKNRFTHTHFYLHVRHQQIKLECRSPFSVFVTNFFVQLYCFLFHLLWTEFVYSFLLRCLRLLFNFKCLRIQLILR